MEVYSVEPKDVRYPDSVSSQMKWSRKKFEWKSYF